MARHREFCPNPDCQRWVLFQAGQRESLCPGCGNAVTLADDLPNTLAARREELGERIRNVRTRQAMTQQELADRARVSRAIVSSIENGHGNPTFENLLMLARALAVPVHFIVMPQREADLAAGPTLTDMADIPLIKSAREAAARSKRSRSAAGESEATPGKEPLQDCDQAHWPLRGSTGH